MINSLDLLYVSLTLSALATVGILGYVAYNLVLTLRSVRALADHVDESAKDIQTVKNTVKLNFFNILSSILSKFSERR